MNKGLAVVLAIVGWVGFAVAMNFNKIVPHASEDEIRPFLVPIGIFAGLATLLAIQKLAASPPRTP